MPVHLPLVVDIIIQLGSENSYWVGSGGDGEGSEKEKKHRDKFLSVQPCGSGGKGNLKNTEI